jgi:anti-sigma B factor antagonist
MEMDLQIAVRKSKGIAIIDLAGEVDAFTSSRFREIMMDIIEGGGTNLIINMTDVQYIDSSGLGALVGGLKRATERKGRITLICERPQVRKVFEITGLEKVFPIFSTEQEALEAASAFESSEKV